MAADKYGFDPDKTTTTPDNEFWDATDAAHPAWWRGCDHGSTSTAHALQAIAETGEHHGTFGGQEIEAAAQKIMTLNKKIADAKMILSQPLETKKHFEKALIEASEILEGKIIL